MRHNPSRAEIHAHMYGVVNGDIETSTTMTVMAHALNAQHHVQELGEKRSQAIR